MEFLDKTSSEHRLVEDFLLKALKSGASDELYEIVKHQVAAGGKRIRPAMTILCCMAVGGKSEAAIPAAAAIELVHNYTLIFDDIIDRSELRRGLPTVRAKYDNVMAILAGMHYREAIFEAAKQSPRPTEIEEILSSALRNIIEGERLDILFEQAGREAEYIQKMMYKSISEKDYFEMIGKKTAALFEAACKVGGVVGNGPPDQVDALSRFGWNCGLAFQVTDDLLDITAKKEELGKEIGKDIKEHKLGNLVILHSLKELSEVERNRLFEILRSRVIGEAEVNEAIRTISSTSAVKQVCKVSKDFASRARTSLNILPISEAKNTLLELAVFIDRRSF
ncbi:MAG: polyprenyl synthetase family protein [Candidatus Bathyarchaeia archaeon]